MAATKSLCCGPRINLLTDKTNTMTHTQEEYKGYTIKIKYDEDPRNPREDSNIGKMICFHGSYNLGDKHNYNQHSFGSWAELHEQLIKDFKNDIILPLYLYNHSGLTMNTKGFSCRWDSGQVGFIIVDRKGLLNCRGVKRITKKEKELLFEVLESEVEEYDWYLTGDAYGYCIEDEDEEEVESCWGHLGDSDYPMQEAKSIVDYIVNNKNK
jgi:hypothetical protein